MSVRVQQISFLFMLCRCLHFAYVGKAGFVSVFLIDDLLPILIFLLFVYRGRFIGRSKNLSSAEAPMIPRILVISIRVRGGVLKKKNKLFRSLILAPEASLLPLVGVSKTLSIGTSPSVL